MASCYHPEVTFGDPVFPHLSGWKASAMWRMLCERGQDLVLEFRDVSADDKQGRVLWEAHYTFSKTGRKVHNRVRAQVKFQDGLIREHRDDFDLKKWMGMALGFKGRIAGLFQAGRGKVQETAALGLDRYISKNSLGPDDFANGRKD